MTKRSSVPPAMLVQLQRLFGSTVEATRKTRSDAEWRKLLGRTLEELFRYIEHNVHSDGLHMCMLMTGLRSAQESLQEDDFWPGYAEGVTRVALLLMGDYPDHRKRRGGKKTSDHYDLARLRTLTYHQNSDQRLATLLRAKAVGYPGLSNDPRQALRKFRDECGFEASYKDFLRWYKQNFPEDYAAVF
jgi:hypothetical protein